jgi:hypothetical protein
MGSEEALVVVGLADGASRLGAEATQLDLAACLLVQRRTSEQLLSLDAEGAELVLRLAHRSDHAIEGMQREAHAEEEGGGDA